MSATLTHPSSAATTVTVSAVSGVYTVGSDATIVIAAGSTAAASDTVTITAVDNDVDAADNAVTVAGTAANDQGAGTVSGASLTIADDDTAGFAVSPATSTSSRLRTTESGGTATFTVKLATEPTGNVVLGVASSDATEGTVSPSSLTFTAMTWNTAQTVTLTGVDDAPTNPVDGDTDYTVTLTVNTTSTLDANYDALSAVTVYAVNADNEHGLDVSTVTGQATESGGTATFTVALNTQPSQPVTVTVTSRDASEGAASPSSLTFARADWSTAQAVTVTGANDTIDDGEVTWAVRLDPSSGDADYNGLANVDVSVTTTDDDGAPGVTLTATPSSISENGGVATVTATLSHPSGAATTVTVTAVTGFYTVGSDAVIVIAAGETANATDTATIAAANNDTDAPDRAGTVTATIANDRATADGTTMAVSGGALTVTDDDGAPTVTLSLPYPSIPETGASSVSATLSHPSSAATTVTVTAVTGFYTVGSDATIVIAAGATANATDTVRIRAVNNTKDEPDRTATVTATVTNDRATADGTTMAVSGASLTITDDDAAPGVTLSVASSSIPENGGSTTVSATLTHPSSAATTVTVSAVSGVYTVGSDATIVIAAGSTAAASDTVTIAAVDNDVDAADNAVTVAGTARNSQGAGTVTGASLTIADDDTAGFAVSPATSTSSRLRTTEDGGTATFTVKLATEPTGDVVLGVASSNTAEGTVSASSLTFTATAWNTAQTVTLTGMDDAPANPADGSQDYTVTLTVNTTSTVDANYDALPAVAVYAVNADNEYGLDVSSVTGQATEAGGQATFTVALVTRPSQPVTVTVSSRDTSEGAASPSSLTFTASDWGTARTVTVTGADDAIDDGDVTWAVRLDPSSGDGNYNGLANVDVSVTTTDDDAAPTAALSLSPSSISENGGESTVSATLSHPSSAATTVTVGAVTGFTTVGSDTTIVIAAGETANATDTVTVTAVNDNVHQGSGGRSTTVTATVANARATADGTTMAVTGAALTLTDDEDLPEVALALSSTSISETGGVATVTARLNRASSAATTVTVSATGATAAAGDFSLSSATTLTIASGSTTSSGTVTVSAVGDTTDEPNETVTVSGTVSGGNGVAPPPAVTLTLTDDEALPTMALALSSTSVSESGGVSTVTATLSGASSEAVTVTVSATGVTASAGDFARSSARTLTIASGSTTSSGTVTVSAVGDTTDEADETVSVSGTVSGGNGVSAPPSVTLTIADDDAAPTVSIDSPSVTEGTGATGGTLRFTVVLSAASGKQVTVAYADAGTGTATSGTDYTAIAAGTLTFAAGTTARTIDVTVTGDALDEVDETVAVTLSTPVNATLAAAATGTGTVTDDEALPTVALVLSPATIDESGSGNATTVTATLSGVSSAAVTVTVAASPVTSTGAVSGDYMLSTATTLTIASGSTTSAGTVTITAADNGDDEPDIEVTVSGTAAGGNGVTAPSSVTLTITDDEDLPTVALSLSPASISESSGVSTVTATLSGASSAAVTLTVSASPVTSTGAVSGDFSLSSATALTIAAGSTTSSGTVTVMANGNAVDSPDKSVTVSGTATGGNGVAAPSAVTLTLTDDETLPTVALALSPASIAEAGGVSTVTATLSGASSAAVTITVSAAAGTNAVSSDFSLSSTDTLTIASGGTTSTGAVTVTANDNTVASGSKQVAVSATAAGGNGVAAPSSATLTITDDDAPQTTLLLSSSSISENGGVATVTARLDRTSSVAVTVTVSAAAGAGAIAADFSLSSAKTLTIAAGSTTSAGAVTVTAVDNAVDSPDKSVTVSGTASDSLGLANDPPSATLTLTDDDDAPNAALSLNPASVSENGGASAVSATLTHPSSAATTVTVTAVSGALYTVGSDATIVIAAGSTAAASDTAAIAAVDDDTHQGSGGRSTTVTATLTNSQGAGTVTGAPLTLTDDETLPTVALALSPASIAEAGGVSTVMARLDRTSSAAVTITVSAAAGTNAVSGDFSLSSATTLTISAGSTTSAGSVTITANDNTVASGSKQVAVSATAAGGNGVAAPSSATLTITDDDTPQTTLLLSSSSISENGGVATVTARLDRTSSVAVTVTVSAAAGAGAIAADFTLTGTMLTIAANATTSAGAVTVTAVDNAVDSPDKSVTVSGTASDSLGLANDPPSATLTLTDDEGTPTVTLALSPASISENGGVSTVTATLDRASSHATTVTVTAAAGFYTVSSPDTLTVAAGATGSTGTVTVTAANDAIDNVGNRSATVTGTAENGHGVGAVTGASLTLTDDEALPVATLALSPATIDESGANNASTVTATLDRASSEAVTLTVSAAAGTNAAAGDFALSTDKTLTIAAGNTASSGTVTVTAVDNAVDSPNKQVTVTAAVSGASGVAVPSSVTLTITDDEGTPTVTLALSPTSISENGGVSTVTATLSGASSEAVTVSVTAAAGTNAAAGDFSLSSANTLTIAAGATTSTGAVTITAVDNSAVEPDKSVTVSGTASGGNGVSAPSSVTLTLTDDEAPTVTLVLSPATIDEHDGTNPGSSMVTARLNRASSAATTITVSAAPGTNAVSGDFTLSANKTLTIAAGATTSTGAVTVTAIDDATDAPDKSVTVSGTASQGVVQPSDVTLTIADDDAAPGVTLALSPSSIPENGGVSTVTAKLSHPSGAATTVTVTAAPAAPAVAGDYTLSTATTLTIAAGSISSSGTVTITANDNDVDAADKTVTVTGTPANSQGAGTVTPATLTIADDDEKGLAFARAEDPDFDRSRVLEVTEGVAASYTVKLTSEPVGTVTVTSDNADVTVNPASLTFDATDWSMAQTVTVTAPNDEDDYAKPAAEVSHTASGGGYGEESGSPPVSGSLLVSVTGETRVRVSGATGPTLYVIDRRRVTVTVGDDVPPGIEVDFGRLGEGPALTLTFKSPDPDLPMEGDGLGLGPVGSRTVVDISVKDEVPEAGIEICLPVRKELREAAAGRPLLLLHYEDGGWRSEGEDKTPEDPGMACVSGVTSASPFAVGYVDTRPEFAGDFAGTAMVFTVDVAIDPVELPKATGGDGTLKYTLTPDLPPGVKLRDRLLFGTPEKEFPKTKYVWTATDIDGDENELEFFMEVKSNLEEARARLKAINESILPELSRAMWGSAVEAVTGRLESSGPGEEIGLSLARALRAQARDRAREDEERPWWREARERTREDEEGLSWRDLMEGRTFAVGLGAGGEGDDGSGSGGSGDAVVWGGGSRQSLSLDKAVLDWSGDLFSAHMGFDGPLGENLRGGLAVSRFEGSIEYTDRSGEAAVAGVHESRMTAAHPYAGWSGPGGSRLWGALGYGAGEIEIVDAEVAKRFRVQQADSAFLAAALGGSVPVLSADGLTLALKASGEATRYSVDDNGEAIAKVSVGTHRLRLSAEGGRAYALPDGGTLAPSLELGVRWDGGDGETGAGVEAGGGLEWSLPGLTLAAQGRTLAAHEGDVKEWGVSGSARLSPGTGGRGLSFELAPRWGASESGLGRLWEDGVAGRTSSSAGDAARARLEGEVGYGYGIWDRAGVLTPYGGFGYEEGGARGYRLGTRLDLGGAVDLSLEAERKEGRADPEHGVRLNLRIRW